MLRCFFFFKQKTAYEMRISDWSSDVCSSDLLAGELPAAGAGWVMDGSFRGEKHREAWPRGAGPNLRFRQFLASGPCNGQPVGSARNAVSSFRLPVKTLYYARIQDNTFVSCSICRRSEEHTSELQSLMRISYAVFCLKKNTESLIRSTVHHTTLLFTILY